MELVIRNLSRTPGYRSQEFGVLRELHRGGRRAAPRPCPGWSVAIRTGGEPRFNGIGDAELEVVR